MSSPSYNRGEWAELYVLAKILCDQILEVRAHGIVEPIRSLSIRRVRRGIETDSEAYSIDGDNIICEHTSKKVQRVDICRLVPAFLKAIKNGNKISFTLSEGDEILRILDIPQLKRGSGLKSDIYLDVVDPLTGTTGLQGYTIKALIGSKPTLFNASEPTNLTYQIDPPLSQADIEIYNKRNAKGKLTYGIRDAVANILATGHAMNLIRMDSRFKGNLELLDSKMPDFVSEVVLAFYSRKAGKATSIKKTVEILCDSNPLEVSHPAFWYAHKIKDLLEASTYGMVPTEPYNGERTVAGGLLLVEKSGGLICFRLDDKDKTRDYLMEHTYFETASRDKHNFGVIQQNDNETFMKLNLQIRYK